MSINQDSFNDITELQKILLLNLLLSVMEKALTVQSMFKKSSRPKILAECKISLTISKKVNMLLMSVSHSAKATREDTTGQTKPKMDK